MKRIDLFIIILALLIPFTEVTACGPYDRSYLAIDYYTFRLCGDNMEGTWELSNKKEEQKCIENCREWASLTSEKIPLADIIEVVYKWNLQQIEALYRATVNEKNNNKPNNSFAQWIVTRRDREVAEFLFLAKRCETVRAGQTDVWYYPVDGDDESVALDDIICRAKEYKGERLKDRYALQIIRALFSNRQYDECLNYWLDNKSVFTDNIIREMSLGYIAGVYFRLGNKEMAKRLYLQCGNLLDASRCCKRATENLLEWIYKINIDEESLLEMLQYKIHTIEGRALEGGYEPIYLFILKVIREKRYNNMAAWYYTGAFVADKLEKNEYARRYIEKARTCETNTDLTDAIRVFDLYLKVKTAKKYTPAFENYLYRELRWLDNKIVNSLNNESRERIIKNGFYNHVCGYSQYYWNDIMRKIIIGYIVPLCIKSNYKTRALQYLNMADNRIFKLVDRMVIEEWAYNPDTISIKNYRNNGKFYNLYDYRNDFFMNLDSIGVKYVKHLADKISNPICSLDTFLNARSYTDLQYFYDIIGTQLIASMKYGEAVNYLSRVSASFMRSRNVYEYCRWDPFLCKKNKHPNFLYKLHFAQNMYDLEQRISIAKNPNAKAEAILQYARGLQSSVGEKCWPLTGYYQGHFYNYPLHSEYQKNLIATITKKAESIKQEAFTLFTDDERAAQAYYEWKMFKTAATRYKNTQIAEYIRGHCDELIDYYVVLTGIFCL